MSVLYRAVWSDEASAQPEKTLEDLKDFVAAWSQETSDPAPLTEDLGELVVSQGRKRSIFYRPVNPHAFEVTVRDQMPGDTTEWTTAIRIVADEYGVHTVVENGMQSDDLTRRVSIGRPGIVHDLLELAEKPTLGGSALLTKPQELPAEDIDNLIDLLAHPERTLPAIVCSEPGGQNEGFWIRSVNSIAKRVEGIATVFTLDNDAVTAFRRKLGDLAIWGGGIRVYAPGPVEPNSDGWRHRYYLRSRLEDATQATIDRIVYSVAQLSSRRRIPDAFRAFGEQSGVSAATLDGMIPAKELEEAREEWEFNNDLALEEQSGLEKELAKAEGHLARLKKELLSRGLGDLIWGTQHETETSIPDGVQDTSEAVEAAKKHLSRWLHVPDSAVRDLQDIDTAPTSFAWGNSTWRGLRALAAYAEDRANGWNKGGFWEWCVSGPPLHWPATTKKLSMTESEGVQTGGKFKGTRVFEVDREVDPSGEITMLAHLKISEGGGNLAPRVYFHDDTRGSTGKVHVGFVGPHHLVPNQSKN